MIEVKNLTKQYGSAKAVDNLSFTVEQGQIYGFLGPNGAGKSTTMNILTGYIAPSTGEVLINGHNILDDPEAARKCIGYLPEIPPVYPEMTVEEYLSFAAGLKKVPKKEQEEMIYDVMEMTDITAMKKRLIRNLSKGYRQRTGLAQALLGYPEIIILDEPMVGLDPKQIIEIRELIRGLGKKHTVILSSHILSEISAICDHIMIISHGNLVASDTPDNLAHLMKGSEALELTVEAEESDIRRALAGVERIDACEIKTSDENGACDITLKMSGGTDLRRKLFYLFAEQKMPVLRMQQTRVSLEDSCSSRKIRTLRQSRRRRILRKNAGCLPGKEQRRNDCDTEKGSKELSDFNGWLCVYWVYAGGERYLFYRLPFKRCLSEIRLHVKRCSGGISDRGADSDNAYSCRGAQAENRSAPFDVAGFRTGDRNRKISGAGMYFFDRSACTGVLSAGAVAVRQYSLWGNVCGALWLLADGLQLSCDRTLHFLHYGESGDRGSADISGAVCLLPDGGHRRIFPGYSVVLLPGAGGAGGRGRFFDPVLDEEQSDRRRVSDSGRSGAGRDVYGKLRRV